VESGLRFLGQCRGRKRFRPDPDLDSYSGFFDNGHRKATGLETFLGEQRVSHFCVLGLATDYCVKFTVLDACELGFHVTVIEDGCRAVNVHAGDSHRAIELMRTAGANVVSSGDIARRAHHA
jgi:nicotinamidase/pyrazinamidase